MGQCRLMLIGPLSEGKLHLGAMLAPPPSLLGVYIFMLCGMSQTLAQRLHQEEIKIGTSSDTEDSRGTV